MLFLEDASQGNISKGTAASSDEMYSASRDEQLYAQGSIMKQRAVRKSWEDKLASIEKKTGEKIPLPQFDGVFMPVFGGVDPEQMQKLQSKMVSDYMQVTRRIEELANQHPEYYEKWMTDPETTGHGTSRAIDKRVRDVSGRNHSWLNSASGFAGAFVGGMQDPINLALAPFGAGKAVAQGAYNLLRAGAINGLIGAAGEAAIQPLSQQWRKEAGLKYGWGEAAKNVGFAFAFGFGIDAGVRGAWRGGKLLKGKIDGKPSQAQADAFYGELKGLDEAESQAQAYEIIEQAASHLPANNPLHKALLGKDYQSLVDAVRIVDPERAEGLAQSRADLGHGTADIVDDELRGAANWLDGEDGRAVPEGLHAADDTAAELQAQRHVSDQDEPPAVMPRQQPGEGASLQDGAVQPLAEKGVLNGKAYSSQKIRPSQIQTDAQAFQFKEGGDSAGITERLQGVENWNPLASGKTMIFQRNNGDYIIADGHQRLGLAKRLEQQDNVELDAFIFKESDGWTPAQVRALAAKKNIQEGTGTALDYARIMRDQPELLDGSVPQNSAKMQHAKGLASLSDDAFGLVVNEVVPANHAALVGRLVADQALHVDLLQQMAKADLGSEAQARIFIGQALQSGTHEITQMTLFGTETTKLSLLPARTKILADALKNFKQNKRLLAAINANADQVEAVGNKLDKEANEAKSLQSAQMAELVEKLSTTHGPVSDALHRAAHTMAHDDISVTKARKMFMEEIEEIYSKQGLKGLAEHPKADTDIIEPGSAEAEKQGDLLGQQVNISLKMDILDELRALPEEGGIKLDPFDSLNDDILKKGLQAVIDRMPEGVRVVFKEKIKSPEGFDIRGMHNKAEKLITVAMRQLDPLATLRHEEMHALRSLGLFSDTEWKLLVQQGKASGLMDVPFEINDPARGSRLDQYRKTYARRPDLEEVIDQEFVAHLFEGRKAGEDLGQQANTILDKLLDFLRKTANALRGMGFQTAEDVFRRIESGEIGRRADTGNRGTYDPDDSRIAYSLEPRRSQDLSRQKGEESIDQQRASTRSNAVPRGQGRNGSYSSTDNPPGIEPLDIQSSNHLKNDEFLIDDGGSLLNKLASLIGLGQKIVAKFPETFNNEAFKNWFGDSKIVTRSGDPLVLYHSTNADFEAFKSGQGDVGFHFGTVAAANERLPAQRNYAKQAGRYYRQAEQILPVVLSIANPLKMKDVANWHQPKVVLAELREMNLIDNDFYNKVMVSDKNLGRKLTAIKKQELSKNTFDEVYEGSVRLQADMIRTELQRQGYDGIVYINAVEGRGSTSYIAFEQGQVKSLFNRGTFDGNDPRITYSIDPEQALDGVRKALAEADQALGKGGRSAQDQAELDQLAKDAPWEDKPGAEGAGQQPQSQNLDDFLNEIGQEFGAKSDLESAVRIEQIQERAGHYGLSYEEMQQAVKQIMESDKPEVSLPGQRPEATPEAEPNFRGTPEQQAAKRAEYIEQKRRAVLTLVAAERVKADMMRHKNAKGQHDIVAAALSHMENFGTAKHSAIAQKETEILGHAMARMSEFVLEFERTKLTGVTPKQKMGLLNDIIRESFGEKTGNFQAEKMAKAWFYAHEGLRERFNRAGGMIGKMDNWGLPQSHSQQAVAAVDFGQWKADIAPLLDRDKTVHHITGQRMTDEEWEASLKHNYETIVSDGLNTREPSLQVQGKGALYKQGSDARFLHFKDADSWLTYAKKYGNTSGTHGADLGFHAMMRHLSGFSRDIAAMEILGPNPNAMQNYMRGLIEKELGNTRLGQAAALPVDGRDEQGRPFVKKGFRKISHEDYVGKGLKKLDDHFDIARGVLDSPVDGQLANWGKTIRNWQVATKLGSATLSAIGDVATYKAALKFAGMKNEQAIVKDIFKYIQAEDRHFAVRSGLILDSSMSMILTESRFGGAVEAATRTGKFADRTLSWSGLSAWTQGIKHAFGMETMANFARVQHLPFEQLDKNMRRLFEAYGLAPGQWDLIRSFAATEHKGVNFLRGVNMSRAVEESKPYVAAMRQAEQAGQLEEFMARPQQGRGYFDQLKQLLAEKQKQGLYQNSDFNVNIRDMTADVIKAKQRYMEIIHAETEYAVPTGTIASQAITKKFQAGTYEGETWRLFFQFKAYPISILMMQGGRTMRLVHGEGKAAGAAYAASTFMAMTLAGGVIGTWLKDLKAGRDPDMDFTSQKNWGRWMAQGGGIGIMGDFLFSDHNRFGGGPLSTFAGPAFGDVEKLLRATAGNAQKLLTGQETSFAKDGLGIVRSNSPGIGSLWYTATAYNRVLLDQMQYLADPAASKSFKRRMKKREKDYGQQYFWPLGDTSPERAPSIAGF